MNFSGLIFNYTKPVELFNSVEYMGKVLKVVGFDGSYEWVLLEAYTKQVEKHSDCGFGSEAAALYSGLAVLLGVTNS